MDKEFSTVFKWVSIMTGLVLMTCIICMAIYDCQVNDNTTQLEIIKMQMEMHYENK